MQTSLSPVEHFYRYGGWLGRDPGPGFSTRDYLERHSDVRESSINPLVHFLVHGKAEGRSITSSADGIDSTVCADPDSWPTNAFEIRRQEGRRQIPGAVHRVMLSAHVAGKYLFGGERSLLDLLDGFADCGIEAVVTVPGLGNGDYLEALLDRCATLICFPYGWWREGQSLNEAWVACFAEVIATCEVTVVHVNTIMLREPLHAARRLGIPSVVHVRELVAHDVALTELIGLDPATIHAQVLESTDWLMANSETTARAFAAPERTLLVPNTVDLDELALAPRAEDGWVNVVMVSSNLPKKGLTDFVEVAVLASKRAVNLRFLLVGPETEDVDALRQAQAAGQLPPTLVLAGYRESPQAAMAEADIVVNFSHFQESFGRTVLEAMAASKPVVAYQWGALSELVQDEQSGYLVPFRDVSQACARLCELAQDPVRRKAMGEAGRVLARHYGRDRFGQRLALAYEQVLRKVPEPRKLLLSARSKRTDHATECRVAYFLWHFPVPSETFVLNELRVLVELGVDVKVYCKQSPYPDFIPDFPIEWTRVASPAELAEALIRSGRTIVHSHFVYPTVTEMVWPACEKAGVQFSFIAHAQDIFRERNRAVNRIGEVARSRLCLRVLAPSRFHHRYLVAEGVPDEKIFPTANGIDPLLYTGLEQRDFARSHRSICAVHRFTEKKGLIHLIHAAALLRSERIRVDLYGYGELEEEFRRVIDAQGLTNVRLMGPVGSREELLEVFSKYDLFACPSVRAADGDMDGIPTVLMEAMAAGLPVLTTAVSGIPDLVEHRLTGYVTEAEPAAIAATVREFFAASELEVASVADNARERVRQRYCVRRATRRMLRLWRGETIDLLIVSWNSPEELSEIIERLQRFTSGHFHLVICDNGSAPATIARLIRAYARYDNLTVILNRENALVGPGTNICLQHSVSEIAFYVCGKEGFTFRKGWEQALIDYMQDNPDIGLAGTLCYSPTYLRAKDYPQGIRLYAKFRGQDFIERNADRYMAHVQGGFFALRRSMIDAIGGFSDDVPHDYTDVEYSLYAESRGWQLGELSGLTALYVKTRPGLDARVTEHSAAMHPPRLDDLPRYDRLVGGESYHCPICSSQFARSEIGARFDRCPGCGSKPIDRSLFHFLAGSRLTYRRLPALSIGLPIALQAFWKEQFQGPQLSVEEAVRLAQGSGRIDVADKRLKLAVLPISKRLAPLFVELGRTLASDGVLLLMPIDESDRAQFHELRQIAMREAGIRDCELWRCDSSALGCAPLPLLVGRRLDKDASVC